MDGESWSWESGRTWNRATVTRIYFLKAIFKNEQWGKFCMCLSYLGERKEMPTLCRLVSGVTTALLAGNRTKGHSGKAQCSTLCVYLFNLWKTKFKALVLVTNLSQKDFFFTPLHPLTPASSMTLSTLPKWEIWTCFLFVSFAQVSPYLEWLQLI